MLDKKILGIVITYKETKLCKNAIKNLAGLGIDVALVFNGWCNEYLKWLDCLDKYLDFKFLNKENLGFCRGNNLAMKLAFRKRYDYVFLLNNDAYTEYDCLDELTKAMEKDEKIGLVQPKVYKAWDKKILDTTGHIFKYGDRYSWEKGFGDIVDRGEYEIDENQYDEIRNILGCCACVVLYKVKMLKNIGLFWERLWSQFEDVELSWRAHKYGWKARYVPEAVAYHWRGYTVKDSRLDNRIGKLWKIIGCRNWTLTLRRHGNFKQRMFTSAMWYYVGCKSWVGKRLRKNDMGGYFVWLCGLALLNDKAFERMEKEFCKILKRFDVSSIIVKESDFNIV